jgi:hypothetical protein
MMVITYYGNAQEAENIHNLPFPNRWENKEW